MDNTATTNDPLKQDYNPIQPSSDDTSSSQPTSSPQPSPDSGNPSTAAPTPDAPGAPSTPTADPGNRMPMGPTNQNRSVKPSDQQPPAGDPKNPHADDPSVQNAGRFHSIAQALAGGQHYKIETDVNTGEIKRVPVPLNGKQIGMAIVLEALTGSLAGLAGGKGKGAGAAGLAGVNAGERSVQQRRQGEDAEFARQATIAKTNMQMAHNQRALAEADRTTHQKDVDSYASLYKSAQAANAVDKVVGEDELHSLLTNGTLNVSKDQAIPIRVVPRMGADGKAITGKHGEPLYQKMFALVKPNTQLVLPDDVKKILVDNKIQGYVDAQGKGINLPDDLEMRMHMIVDGIEKANTIRWAQESFDGYGRGQMNPMHKDTTPGGNSTSMPELKDDKIASLVDQAAHKHGIDPALLRSLVLTESNGKPTAKSNKGAQGLGQLMPSTAKAYGVTDPLDPEQNINGSARFLKDLITERHGDIRGALIAYHGKGWDGITTGEQYADGILKRINQGGDAGKEDTPFKPVMSVSDALEQHVLTPKDLQVMQQMGGVSSFLNGNPKNGDMSSAQKMAEQHPDKVPPDSIGRIIHFMGGQEAIDQYRTKRTQYFQDQDENRAIDKAKREAQNKQALDNESAEAMASIVRGPDGFELGKTIPNFADLDSNQLQASLKSQGVQVPNNFDDLYAVAHYDVPASNLPQRLWRKGDPLAMSQQDGVSYIRKFLNPAFRQYEYDGRKKDWDSIMNPDSKVGQTIVNAGTATQHLNMLKEASDALDQGMHGNLRPLNQLANALGIQVGKTPALTYTAIADKAADEVSKVAMGNAPFKEQVLSTRAILTPANATQQTDAVIKSLTKLMYGRIKSIDDDTFKKQQKHLPNVSDDTTKLFQQYSLDAPWAAKPQAQSQLANIKVNSQTGQQIGWDATTKQWLDVKTRQPYAAPQR